MVEWQHIDTAPFDRDLELAVLDRVGLHSLVFSCRRTLGGCWVNSKTAARVNVYPTHWREWIEALSPSSARSGCS